MEPKEEESLDTMFNGKVKLLQPVKGYRFSADSLLLSGFARIEPGQKVLELGAGCGVISLLSAYNLPEARYTLMEIQPELARMALRNSLLNDLTSSVSVFEGDLKKKSSFPAGSFDVIMTNPPFRPEGSGRLSPSEQRNKARHELCCTQDDWIKAAGRWLAVNGRLFVVYPVWRMVSLFEGLYKHKLIPKRMRLVYARPEGPGRLVLIEAVKGSGEELSVDPPFYIHQQGQNWSDEMNRLVNGELSGAV